jgi:hypothetical protein
VKGNKGEFNNRLQSKITPLFFAFHKFRLLMWRGNLLRKPEKAPIGAGQLRREL